MTAARWAYLPNADRAPLAAMLDDWASVRPARRVLALASEHEPDAIPALQHAARQAGLALSGVVVPGLIADGRLRQAGVLLLALDAAVPQLIVSLACEDIDPAERLAAFVTATPAADATLLLFVDAAAPSVTSLLDRLYLAVGNEVRYAGTSVGSARFEPIPCVFTEAEVHPAAALALLLPDHPGAALAHHYSGAAPLSVATGAEGNRVTSIDGLPAIDAYRERLAVSYDITLSDDECLEHFVQFPLALHQAEGEPLVRFPVAVGDDGSLYCVGEVPEVALLSVVAAPPETTPDTARAVATDVARHGPPAALAFACAGRLMRRGADADLELAEMARILAPAPLFGALSLGEIASYESQGYPRFHNATLLVMPWR